MTDIINLISSVLLGWFVAYILHQELNIAYRIKLLFKIRPTKHIKIIDCYPCVTFWVTLSITLNPMASIGAYLIAVIIDRK